MIFFNNVANICKWMLNVEQNKEIYLEYTNFIKL